MSQSIHTSNNSVNSEKRKYNFVLPQRTYTPNYKAYSDLENYRQWTYFGLDKLEDGSLNKIPLMVNRFGFAKTNDSSTWARYQDAIYKYNPNKVAGLAFVITDKDDICCIDLDKCLASDGTFIKNAEITSMFGNTLIEKSISGKGLHIWIKADKSKLAKYNIRNDSVGVEFYRTLRFMALSGDIYKRNPIVNCTDLAIEFCEKYLGVNVETTVATKNTSDKVGLNHSNLPSSGYKNNKTERDLYNIVNSIDEYRQIYNNSKIGNESALDWKIICFLLKGCKGDCSLVESFLLKSPRFRDKFIRNSGKGHSYLQVTIYNALNHLQAKGDI